MHLIVLVLIILIQILLNLFLIVSMVAFNDSIELLGIPIHLILIFILNISSLIILAIIAKKEEKRKVSITETTHEKQYQALVTSVRSDRHDLNNHLTVIAGLIKLNNYVAVTSYVNDVVGDVKINNKVLSVRNPILSSMLFTKMTTCQTEKVPFKVDITSEAFSQKMSSTDLIRLLSNLIDNAYEATIELPKERQQIILNMREDRHYDILTVKNSSTCKRLDERFFEVGFSTKSTSNRGYGLTIIKQIIKKYNGILEIKTEESMIVLEILLPRSV